MPCRCDDFGPPLRVLEYNRVCALLCFVKRKLNLQPSKSDLAGCNKTDYVAQELLNTKTANLCNLLSNLNKEEEEEIVYNARSKQSRDLADWWEAHQAWDKRRKKQEEEAKRQAKLVEQAKSKLTQEELKALKKSL